MDTFVETPMITARWVSRRRRHAKDHDGEITTPKHILSRTTKDGNRLPRSTTYQRDIDAYTWNHLPVIMEGMDGEQFNGD